MKLLEAISLLQTFKRTHRSANKAELQKYFLQQEQVKKVRSVYVVEHEFSIRFSEANTLTFSNVVLSLSALRKHDALPIVVCIVRPKDLDFRLINSTFIKKLSHSSHNFTADNIRGSFLGHDILHAYEDTPNTPENFEKLLMLHREFLWVDNIARLVESTTSIAPSMNRFEISEDNASMILQSPQRAKELVGSKEFTKFCRDLCDRVRAKTDELLKAAEIDNVNLRGNEIEKIITGELNAHRVDDLKHTLPLSKVEITVDIKTKLLDRSSSPKAYNIDKTLRLLSKPNTAFFFLFVGLDVRAKAVKPQVVCIFDRNIIAATRVQSLWAGRSSRGVTQLSGDLEPIFADDFTNTIDVAGGKRLLTFFIKKK